MDGNNRWSKLNNIDLKTSYKKGAEKLFNIVDRCFFYHNVDYVSAFALSSHNLSRPKKLISPIIKLLDFYLDEFLNDSSKKIDERISDLFYLSSVIEYKQKVEEILIKPSQISYTKNIVNNFERKLKQNKIPFPLENGERGEYEDMLYNPKSFWE